MVTEPAFKMLNTLSFNKHGQLLHSGHPGSIWGYMIAYLVTSPATICHLSISNRPATTSTTTSVHPSISTPL